MRMPPPGLPRAVAADPRYRVLTEIGRGGMGVVYDAIDRETGERVAIKVLSSRKDGLLRFKNEFRLASRLTHPNLVALYDLVLADEAAYFVMEHAPGVDLRRYVRGKGRPDLPRLYACLTQMLDALECLNAAGIVHRDLKPSNVLVSEDGHLRLLDFGLAGAADTPDFSGAMLAGTPTYMSPEQIAGQPLTPAADLYALGVIVYELLVGEPPFVGPQRAVLHAQQVKYPLPPSDRASDIPPELELWCLKLLAKRPEERFASPRAARQALFSSGAPASTPADGWGELGSDRFAALRDRELIGRDSERALLEALLDRVQGGACHMALITGESGIGKTALAESLCADAELAGCVVLRGACRERESVPYNAFDAVVDAAAAQVERLVARGTLARAQLAEVGDDFALLGRLFPVLRELESDAPAEAPSAIGSGDRERAFGVCKRLVERVTRAHPLVLLLDDLHWADEDSLALLGHLLAAPGGTGGLMVIATAWPPRQSVRGEAPPLERFLRGQRQFTDGDGLITHLALGPLGELDGARVVGAVAGQPVDPGAAATIQREAAGNPFLLVELARLHTEEGAVRPTVREATRRRLRLLDDDERALVELAALAPEPVEAELLHATLEAYSRPLSLEGAGLRRLVGLKILRESGARGRSVGGVRYDFYHHRIRETIRSEIPASRRRALHLRLADSLAELHPDDAEALVRELLLGGDELRAATYAEAAAEAAMSRLAHARAADLFRLALKYAGRSDAPRLHVRLGQALEGTARFGEAAEQYRAGLGDPDGAQLRGVERTRVELRLAHCLMQVGRLEQSGSLVERCLADLGHRPHRSRPRRALAIAWLLVRILFCDLFVGRLRKRDTPSIEARLTAYSLAVPHFQFTSRNLEQLEFALRYRLLGTRSPAAEVRQEAHAMGLVLLLPFAHVGGPLTRPIARHFRALEAGAAKVATERSRAWLPLLRALYAMVSGRPDLAIAHFAELRDLSASQTGYVALQRHNALFLSGAYDAYVADVAATAHHDGALKPLDIARLAYIERVRGHRETARRLTDDLARTRPEDVPWTHRSPYTYQLVELKLLDGDSIEAVRLARSLQPRIRRGAISPTTGAYESVDAVVRAFLSEARRLARAGERGEAEAIIEEARRALGRAPILAPPLFSARLYHDRALIALALGRRARALRLFDEAEKRSRARVVPCFRMRLCEDLLELLSPTDPRRDAIAEEAAKLALTERLVRRAGRAPWLDPLA
ncbi:MAG TPA: protein kinase [Polyangia bacterium]